MRDGYTVTIQRLTWDGTEPDKWTDQDDIDPLPRYVLRQYDRIVRSVLITTWDRARLTMIVTEMGGSYDPDDPSWLDYCALADDLHRERIHAQPETLLDQSSVHNTAA